MRTETGADQTALTHHQLTEVLLATALALVLTVLGGAVLIGLSALLSP